jgi:hypothetical protein
MNKKDRSSYLSIIVVVFTFIAIAPVLLTGCSSQDTPNYNQYSSFASGAQPPINYWNNQVIPVNAGNYVGPNPFLVGQMMSQVPVQGVMNTYDNT